MPHILAGAQISDPGRSAKSVRKEDVQVQRVLQLEAQRTLQDVGDCSLSCQCSGATPPLAMNTCATMAFWRAALMMLAGQTGAGYLCPVSMTCSALPALRRQHPALAKNTPKDARLCRA
ncbi:MAG: hypothetical protein HYR60_01835 [Acidobacteria bacterium]|nr:hypothetical protein [Acidobacteriota bacterium]